MGKYIKSKPSKIDGEFTPNEIHFSENELYCVIDTSWYIDGAKFFKTKNGAINYLNKKCKEGILISEKSEVFKVENDSYTLYKIFELDSDDEYRVYRHGSPRSTLINEDYLGNCRKIYRIEKGIDTEDDWEI